MPHGSSKDESQDGREKFGCTIVTLESRASAYPILLASRLVDNAAVKQIRCIIVFALPLSIVMSRLEILPELRILWHCGCIRGIGSRGSIVRCGK